MAANKHGHFGTRQSVVFAKLYLYCVTELENFWGLLAVFYRSNCHPSNFVRAL